MGKPRPENEFSFHWLVPVSDPTKGSQEVCFWKMEPAILVSYLEMMKAAAAASSKK
jgi:hypothetical protein